MTLTRKSEIPITLVPGKLYIIRTSNFNPFMDCALWGPFKSNGWDYETRSLIARIPEDSVVLLVDCKSNSQYHHIIYGDMTGFVEKAEVLLYDVDESQLG